jgi:drug/metabolite transporter (DMT)-like permease
MSVSKIGARNMILSVLFFNLGHMVVKFLPHMPFYQLVFIRAAAVVLLVAPILWAKKIGFRGKNPKLLFYRGFFGTIALVSYFYGLQRMPLTSAVTIQYLSPLVTLILAQVFLKEPGSRNQWICFLFSFLGVYLVQGFDPRITPNVVISSGISVLASACAYNLVRMLKDYDHELLVVFYFHLVVLPFVTPFAIGSWVAPTSYEWVLLMLMAGATLLAQMFMTMSYQTDKAADVAIYNFLGTPLTFVLGYFFFSETLGLIPTLGILLILVSVWFSRDKKIAIGS